LMPHITTSKKYQNELGAIKRKIEDGDHFEEKPMSSLTVELMTKIHKSSEKIERIKKLKQSLVDFNSNVVDRKRGHERSPSPLGRKRKRSSSSPFNCRSGKYSGSHSGPKESFISPR
jgi:hypothetical protein